MKIAFIVFGTENLGIEYLAGALAKEGHQTKQIFDPDLFNEGSDILRRVFSRKAEIIEEIKEFKPNLVGFSVVTSTYQRACAVAQEIKKISDIPIVFGGYHASAVPDLVINNDFVDLVCIGEGEEAICELANSLEQGRPDTNIKNLWFKDKGKVVKNPLRPLVQDLDQLPFPDKSIYKDVPLMFSKYMIATGRGCPFDCTFCGNSFLHQLYPASGKAIRRRSIDNVLGELKEARSKYKFKKVLFIDDAFGQDRQWIGEFLKRYKKEVNLPFFCNPHVLYLDEELIRLLKDAGCFLMQTGIETVSQGYRKEMLNRPETNAHIEFVLQTCKKYKLKIQVDHMLGLPLEGEQEQQQAAVFYNRMRPDTIACFRFTYYPGAKMVKLARDNGWLTEDEIKSIEEGKLADYGDYRHNDVTSNKEPNKALMSKNFLILFKLLPLLPVKFVKYVIDRRLYRFFHFLPYNLVDFLRMTSMIKNRDYVLWEYYRYYSFQAIKKFF
ncbi:MAG TPA: radical SAM protein [Candidatus Omnitrophota bacterium]|nr:radical SAM protein [Candidatus Omnitrophota bacterium]HPT39202.1 radical SAM protein [Candidatus Omnitrophota bacterium]